jgi:hypothetical protein
MIETVLGVALVAVVMGMAVLSTLMVEGEHRARERGRKPQRRPRSAPLPTGRVVSGTAPRPR